MAKDVDAALRDIVAGRGHLDAEATDAYLTQLSAEKRYLRDIY
jgi:sulfite reductase (NADPH) flavoprotein alpha-component